MTCLKYANTSSHVTYPRQRGMGHHLDINKHIGTDTLISNQRTIGPENAHLKPDPGVLSHHEMTLTMNTHTPLLNS